jgi:HD-GYP domain-containing protein (c-di-GMP phosphodiesterase class II)
MERLEHQKDLYKKLINNQSFKDEINILKGAYGDTLWWVSEGGKKLDQITITGSKCLLAEKGKSNKSKCINKLLRLLQKARRTKEKVRFDCGAKRCGICIPVVQGDRIYGYILICHSKDRISDEAISLFTNFIDTLVRELQKELELAKLYRTIRPKAIALSTIHTIHRIISSTLDLDELLPKLVRLCLQVFRAQKCGILLRKQGRKTLVVVAINKRGKSIISHDESWVKRIGKEQVLSKGKIIMKERELCTPLTDEDTIGAICIMDKANKAAFDEFDREILMTLSEQAAIAIKNAQLYRDQENIILGCIKSMATILDTRTAGTYKVKESFVKITIAMGKELNLRTEDLRSLHFAAILHDAGQIGFSDELLTKTDKLTGKEYSIIKRHPSKSVSIVRHISFLKPVIPIILHHHENYDGSGYPKGLQKDRIPVGARIMAVASAFNAMVTKRPYRREVDVRSAINEIKRNSGTQFDPRVVNALLKIVKNREVTTLLKKGL